MTEGTKLPCSLPSYHSHGRQFEMNSRHSRDFDDKQSFRNGITGSNSNNLPYLKALKEYTLPATSKRALQFHFSILSRSPRTNIFDLFLKLVLLH